MESDDKKQDTSNTGLPEGARTDKLLPPAAKRALAEAAERRAQYEKTLKDKEVNGPDGKEPTRYGDWERGGIASDF